MLPPNQSGVDDLIRLDLGVIPEIDINKYRLELRGDIKNKVDLSFNDFSNLGYISIADDFHCVTGWSKLGAVWEGVSAQKIIELAVPSKDAKYVLISSYDGYSTNIGIKDFSLKNSIFAVKYMEKQLKPENGFPVRYVLPVKYAYKSAKWVKRVDFLDKEELGFWEKRGYSNNADPLKEERYS